MRSTASLQTFTLTDLDQYTKEGGYSSNMSKDFHLFYVGRDDVHGILKHLLSRIATSIYLNMFGNDDDELTDECMRCAREPSITTVITLDESQSRGVHEKKDSRFGRGGGPSRVQHALCRRYISDASDQSHQGRYSRW